MKNRKIKDVVIFSLIFLYLLSITYARVEPRASLDSPQEFNPEEIPFYTNTIIVLTYHVVDDKAKGPISISPKLFEEHIKFLKYLGFHFVTPDTLREYMEGKQDIPDNAILVTFDDGYENFYTKAYPILIRYHIPAENFIIVSMVGKKEAFPHLTWDQMREMLKSNLVYFGSHTYDLHHLVRTGLFSFKPALVGYIYKPPFYKETKEEYESRISIDLWYSKFLLEKNLNIKVYDLCFPYGAYNEEVLKIASQLGYKVFYTTEKGINIYKKQNYILVQRINAGSYNMTPEKLKNIIFKFIILHNQSKYIKKILFSFSNIKTLRIKHH